MTAAIKQNGRAFLYADSAFVDSSSGVVVGFAPKLRIGRRFPFAVAVTFNGPPAGFTNALSPLDAIDDAEALAAALPLAVARFKRQASEGGHPSPAMRLMAAAWDAKHCIPRIFVSGDGAEAYGESQFWMPAGTVEIDFAFGTTLDVRGIYGFKTPNDPAAFDHITGAIEAFNSVREARIPPMGGLPDGAYIGGQLWMAEIGPRGFLSVIHTWPDKLGERICSATTDRMSSGRQAPTFLQPAA